jgi:branched-chain amino acid transport system substrate-binding protein
VFKRSFKLAGVALVAASLAFTGCGSRTEATTGGSAGTAKVAKIGFIAPLSGGLSALGLGMRNSVDLAIRQANESNAIPGWKLELAAMDDEAKPDVGQSAATSLAADADVVGVVGTLNSGVALSVIPVLQAASIVQISPANTGTALTQGNDPANKKRPHDNYFRTATTDAIQGPAGAQFVLAQGIKKVATVHDKQAYGQGLVEAFTKTFTEGGGTVVAAETTTVDERNFSTIITKVKTAGAELLYYGGQYPEAGPLSKQMKAAGLKIPLMGGDGIVDDEYIKQAGTTSEGDLATSVGAPADSLATAKDFVAAYGAAGFKEGMSTYGPLAYDAANAIINGLKVSLKDAADAKSARPATVKAVQAISFDGVSGKVAFDEFGDAVTKIITVNVVSGGKFTTKDIVVAK